MRRQTLAALAMVPILALGLSACGAVGKGTGTNGTAKVSSDLDKMRAFAKCMRENGVDMPDPERRAEIGLRRSLGATRGQIRLQFLTESQLLAALGGVGGVALGILVTAIFAVTQGWPTVVPPWAMAGGIGATLIIGGIAGLYPAIRAARLAPTEALSGP